VDAEIGAYVELAEKDVRRERRPDPCGRADRDCPGVWRRRRCVDGRLQRSGRGKLERSGRWALGFNFYRSDHQQAERDRGEAARTRHATNRDLPVRCSCGDANTALVLREDQHHSMTDGGRRDRDLSLERLEGVVPRRRERPRIDCGDHLTRRRRSSAGTGRRRQDGADDRERSQYGGPGTKHDTQYCPRSAPAFNESDERRPLRWEK